jgi:AbrB family looped-hinge helix DNA binding protein
MVIPAAVRDALGIQAGGEVLLTIEGGAVRLRTRKQALREAQELVGKHVPDGVSLVDELIAERRAEAARE